MTFPPLVWETVNLLLANLGICVVIIFGRYLLYETMEHGFKRMRMRAAIGISVWAIGEVTIRGAAGIGRHIENNGGSVRWMLEAPWGFLPVVGALIGGTGMLCVIRVFWPDDWRWGSWGWIICAILTVIATAIQVSL